MDRIKSTVFDAHRFSLAVIVVMSIILYLLQDAIVAAFGANADAAALVSLFCTWLAATFIFNGSQFISNATLNNLGYPHYSTILNFTRATAGTIPFVYFGALWAGAPGVLIGQAAGSVIVGIASVALSLHMLRKCSGADGPLPGPRVKPFNLKIPLWPQTNTRG